MPYPHHEVNQKYLPLTNNNINAMTVETFVETQYMLMLIIGTLIL